MVITDIKLVNFRNHNDYVLDFKEITTTILGENGCGKTSVLEAIYLALQGKSFRAVDREIIQRGRDFYRVELGYSSKERVVVTCDGEKRQFLIDDKKYGRLPKLKRYPVVLFEPEDLDLINISPGQKRAYFDRFLGQLDEKYTTKLNKYNKALKQRNEALKSDFLREEELFSWNVLLAQYGCELRRYRESLMVRLNNELTEKYQTIAQNKDRVNLKYIMDGGIDETRYLKQLEKSFNKDKVLKCTNYGAHRDNYEFYFNGAAAEHSASRGEVRSIVIALKFIEAEMLKQELRKKPVILLDDVFSELDQLRRKCLVQNFKSHQVILTNVK